MKQEQSHGENAMRRSCLALLAVLALAAHEPSTPGAALQSPGDVHDSGDIGLELRQLPGATATADYVLRRGAKPAGPWPSDHAAQPVAVGVRYIF